METQKKKVKKGFAVPVAKPDGNTADVAARDTNVKKNQEKETKNNKSDVKPKKIKKVIDKEDRDQNNETKKTDKKHSKSQNKEGQKVVESKTNTTDLDMKSSKVLIEDKNESVEVTTQASVTVEKKELKEQIEINKENTSNEEVKETVKSVKTSKEQIEVNKENTSNEEVKETVKSVKTSKATDKPPKKVQRSLSDEEYEDLFAAVLERMMNLQPNEEVQSKTDEEKDDDHQRGIKDSNHHKNNEDVKGDDDQTDKNKEAVKGDSIPITNDNHTDDKDHNKNNHADIDEDDTDNKDDDDDENKDDDDDDESETKSLVIQVTVKVEEPDAAENFDNMVDEEDIDNWDSKEDCPEKTERSKAINENNNARKTPPKPKQHNITKHPISSKSMAEKKNVQEPKIKKPKDKMVKGIGGNVKKFSTPKEKKLPKEKSKQKIGKMTPKSSKKEKISLKHLMLNRELEDLGTWVQCGNTACLKWRYLRNVTDPIEIPTRWECNMNSDVEHNHCDKPEQDYDEAEHIYTKYTEGSVVLAKMAGYPWWPAMIEIDPDYDTYFEVAVPASMYPTKYHVVFFDKNVSRAWINIASIKPFEDIDALPRKCKGHDYKREITAAVKNATEALGLSIKERLKKYSFSTRFAGKWGHFGESTPKKRKKMSKPRGPNKKRKTDMNDNLVDEETLDQILNNSQSVLSDVAEMLTSVENGALDSEDDLEFVCEKTSKAGKSYSDAEEENEDGFTLDVLDKKDKVLIEEVNQFDILKFDKDIFTMEMDSEPLQVAPNLNVNNNHIENISNTDNEIETQDENTVGRKTEEAEKTKSKRKRSKDKETSKEQKGSEDHEMSKKKKKRAKEEKDMKKDVSDGKDAEKGPKKKKKKSKKPEGCETDVDQDNDTSNVDKESKKKKTKVFSNDQPNEDVEKETSKCEDSKAGDATGKKSKKTKVRSEDHTNMENVEKVMIQCKESQSGEKKPSINKKANEKVSTKVKTKFSQPQTSIKDVDIESNCDIECAKDIGREKTDEIQDASEDELDLDGETNNDKNENAESDDETELIEKSRKEENAESDNAKTRQGENAEDSDDELDFGDNDETPNKDSETSEKKKQLDLCEKEDSAKQENNSDESEDELDFGDDAELGEDKRDDSDDDDDFILDLEDKVQTKASDQARPSASSVIDDDSEPFEE